MKNGWNNIDKLLYYQDFLYIPEVISTKLISRYYNNPLASHFKIDKIQKLITRKYFWSTFCRNIKSYMKGSNVCLASKTVRYKLIIDWLMKIIYYELVKIIINISKLIKVIINVIMWYHSFSDSIVTNWGLPFTFKFWLLLYYFLRIKQKLSMAFHSQTDS